MWASREAPATCSIEACSALRALVGRSLAEVRLTQGVQNHERFRVCEFIDELVPSARIEAQSRGITLAVMPIDNRAMIEADRQVLAAVVGNLLQNAFKFTQSRNDGDAARRRERRARAHRGAGRMRRPRRVETSTSCSAHSSSAAPIEPALALGSRSAGGAPKRTTAASTRATCRTRDASSPSICRESRRRPSSWSVNREAS